MGLKADEITDVAGTGAPAFLNGVKSDEITDLAGTGAPDFPFGAVLAGLTGGSGPAAGKIGQVLLSNASVNITTSYQTMTSLALPAGNWFVVGVVCARQDVGGNSSSLFGQLRLSAEGDLSTNFYIAGFSGYAAQQGSSSLAFTVMPIRDIKLSSSDTVNLRFKGDAAGNNYDGAIFALRYS